MRSNRSGRRRRAFVVALAVAAACGPFAFASPAAAASAEPAAAAGPKLTAATLDVKPDPESSSATVREEITVSGVEKGAPVKNLLTRFDGVRVVDLEVTADGQSVETKEQRAERTTTLTFPAPAAGKLTYTASYRVENAEGASELPLLVPAYASGEERVVAFTYRIPDGYHLQGSPFPVGIGDTGVQKRQLLGVPTFLDYRLGTSPTSPITLFSVLGVAVVALIVGLSVLVIVKEARASRKKEAHV